MGRSALHLSSPSTYGLAGIKGLHIKWAASGETAPCGKFWKLLHFRMARNPAGASHNGLGDGSAAVHTSWSSVLESI